MSSIDPSSDENVKGERLLKELIDNVKHCQQRFGGKKEIATENNEIVTKLCAIWEDVICYGIKIQNSSSLLRNVQEIVYGNNDVHLWDFFQMHLTRHEQQRFNSLENVSTKQGKVRALIRASLNERSLERYLYMWLGDPSIKQLYEPWALMVNTEAVNLLPSIAAGLASILFAITINSASIDIVKSLKKEPVIATSVPVAPKKRTVAVKRHILSPDECESVNSGSLSSDGRDIDKDLNLSSDEGIVHSPHPLISDIINSDIFTFQENFTDNLRENSIPENSSTKHTSEASEVSSIVSTSSFSCEDHRNTEEQLKEALERCAFLEGRIAELSLENRRLHRLLGIDCNNTENYSVAIPRVVLINSGRTKFHVYQIRISFKHENDDSLIEKRYSEFYQLHQTIKKKNEFVRALDFPPKKFGRINSVFLEERRQRLQIYLRHLLALLPETACCKTREELQAAFPFLR